MDRDLAETREQHDALAADKDLAKKASEDFKARLEKTSAEAEARTGARPTRGKAAEEPRRTNRSSRRCGRS